MKKVIVEVVGIKNSEQEQDVIQGLSEFLETATEDDDCKNLKYRVWSEEQ